MKQIIQVQTVFDVLSSSNFICIHPGAHRLWFADSISVWTIQINSDNALLIFKGDFTYLSSSPISIPLMWDIAAWSLQRKKGNSPEVLGTQLTSIFEGKNPPTQGRNSNQNDKTPFGFYRYILGAQVVWCRYTGCLIEILTLVYEIVPI